MRSPVRLYSRLPLLSPVLFLLVVFSLLSGTLAAQSLTMVSGNGQMVLEQFISTLPLTVQAKDAGGQPLAGVTVNWSITQGSATLHNPQTVTDVNGMANTFFLATSLVQAQSFEGEVVTAATSVGTVNFFVTTVLSRLSNGNISPPPLVSLVTPAFENRAFSAAQGTTIPGGVVIQVGAQSGIQQGQAVPNVGVRIINNQDPGQPSPATCASPTGVVLTDSKGFATCDLVITGSPGPTQLTAVVGEIQQTGIFTLTVTPGVTCTYSLSATSQSFGSSGGAGTVNVNTTTGCGWATASNASFITVNSGSIGSGNGPVGFTVAANTGAARSGTVTIAGQTFTVSQAALNSGALAIATASTLPSGTTGFGYSATLAATGGQLPYTWSIAGSLPPGLGFNGSTVTISGTSGAPGTYGFTATVTDSLGAQQSQNFSITINSSVNGFAITNVSFATGVVGQAYQQLLTTSGGCVSPFSPMPNFTVSGGALPTGLTLQTNSDFTRSIIGTPTSGGTFNFTLTATDACAKSVSAGYSITVNGSVGALQLLANPTALSFTVATGGGSAPGDQTIAITSSSGVLSYNATVATTSGGNWLLIRSGASGNTPGSITLGVVNFSNLAAGTYNGSLTITSQANNNPVVVPVSLVVVTSATINVSPNFFILNQPQSATSSVARRSMIVTTNSGTVHFTVASSTSSGGNWLAVSPAVGDTPASLLVLVDNGGLAVGTYNGVITVVPVGGVPQTIPVTLNVLASTTLSASPSALSFSYQQGGPLPGTQLVTVNTSSGAAVNVSIAPVTQTGGNWLQVDRINGTAPLIVTVSITPAGLGAGTYTGAVYVVAGDPSVTPLPIAVTLTVTQTAPSLVSVTNGASFAPGPVAPGEIVTLFGGFMGPATLTQFQLTPAGKLATILAGTQVFFDGFESPVVYTSAGQVSVVVPYEITGQSTTQVQVKYLGIVSNSLTLRVIDASPGIFVTDASGQGAILNQGNSVNSVQNGATPNSVISVFATGEGQTNPGGVDGSIAGALPLPQPKLTVTAQIDGLPATVTYAGAAPGLPAGVLQVNIRVPGGVRRGLSVPISITAGTAGSQSGVTVFIQP
jgi:trimeric autotransporter adhesin